ncbi:MAG: pyridoxal-phosphate dependent enzyme [Chlorobi bacterium]|nr:pyridoxal-phosphate dependent enzyme [Chlorobiota bacterium]
MLNAVPTKENILEAEKRIKKFIHRTPILTSESINGISGAKLFFKCENFQKVGAFKFRGATNAILSLPKEELSRGVATHSSGNHAAALSLAAIMNGVPAYIVMPKTAPKIKIDAVKEYGGIITFCEPTLEARETELKKVVEKTGATFVHPYDNYDIIAGQATCAKEIIESVENIDYILAPVGGGGLLSGTALSAKYFGENIKVSAAEPEGADDAFRSLRDGKIYPSTDPNTIADGLLTSLSEKTFEIIENNVEEIITVSDEEIIYAMRMIWERMKIIVEPSSAVTLAAVLKQKTKFADKKIALILSGGNVDLENLPF